MTSSPATKADALQEIITIARNNHITAADISRALRDSREQEKLASGGIISRLLGYLGGIFVFAGISIFIGMQWNDMGSAARVIITLGSGFSAIVLALVALGDDKFERAATPLFLVGNLLQAGGILVMLQEYGMGGDPRMGALFMSAILLIQNGLLFASKKRGVLAFMAILFGAGAFTTAGDLLMIDNTAIGLALGFSLLCLCYALDHSPHRAVAPFWYFIGGILVLASSYDFVRNTMFEVLFVGIAAGMIYLSATVRSRALLGVSTVGMLAYIGHFTAEHFSDTLGWPISLMLIGLALISMGALALKINNTYIRDKD